MGRRMSSRHVPVQVTPASSASVWPWLRSGDEKTEAQRSEKAGDSAQQKPASYSSSAHDKVLKFSFIWKCFHFIFNLEEHFHWQSNSELRTFFLLVFWRCCNTACFYMVFDEKAVTLRMLFSVFSMSFISIQPLSRFPSYLWFLAVWLWCAFLFISNSAWSLWSFLNLKIYAFHKSWEVPAIISLNIFAASLSLSPLLLGLQEYIS